jgi:hypothetical protein
MEMKEITEYLENELTFWFVVISVLIWVSEELKKGKGAKK